VEKERREGGGRGERRAEQRRGLKERREWEGKERRRKEEGEERESNQYFCLYNSLYIERYINICKNK
jgi:hypothetical protein